MSSGQSKLPADPAIIGWVPNSFGPSAASLLNVFSSPVSLADLTSIAAAVTLSGTGSGVITRAGTISAARLATMFSAPLDMVPALGANLTVVPIDFSISTVQTAAYGAAPLWRLRFAGNATDFLTASSSDLNNNRNKFQTLTAPNNQYSSGGVPTPFGNQAFQLSLSADPAGGSAVVAWVLSLRVAFIPS